MTTSLTTEEALRESEARNLQLFNCENAVKLLIDPADGAIVDCNPQASAFYGYSPETLKTLRISDINTLSETELNAEIAATEEAGRDHFLFTHRLASGEERQVEVHSTPLSIGGRFLLFSIIHNISDCKLLTLELARSKKELSTIMDSVSEAIFTVELPERRILFVNQALGNIFAYGAEEVLGESTRIFYHCYEDFADFGRKMEQAIARGLPHLQAEQRLRKKGGEGLWAEISITFDRGSFVAVIRDITERKEAEEALQQSEERYRSLVTTVPFGIQECDTSGRIIFSNPAHHRILAYSEGELLGKKVWDMQSSESARNELKAYLATLLREKPPPTSFITKNLTKDGRVVDLKIDWNYRWGAQGEVAGFVAAISDITMEKRYEERIWYQANFDALTDLPSRPLFLDRLSQTLAEAEREEWSVGVMFVDLDRFKWVNDNLGHRVGDQVLQEAAQQLKLAVRGSDTVARLGGDEFTIILPKIRNRGTVEIVARRIRATLGTPFFAGGRKVSISGSIGIALSPRHGKPPGPLLKKADAAMYQAKQAGGNCFRYAEP